MYKSINPPGLCRKHRNVHLNLSHAGGEWKCNKKNKIIIIIETFYQFLYKNTRRIYIKKKAESGKATNKRPRTSESNARCARCYVKLKMVIFDATCAAARIFLPVALSLVFFLFYILLFFSPQNERRARVDRRAPTRAGEKNLARRKANNIFAFDDDDQILVEDIWRPHTLRKKMQFLTHTRAPLCCTQFYNFFVS